MSLNQEILIYLNDIANSNTLIKDIVYVFADLPIFFLPIFLVVGWLYFNHKKNKEKKENLLFIFYSTFIGIFLALIIQQFIMVERPEEYIKNASSLILNHVPDASFPSDHAVVSIAFLVSLFLFGFKKIGYIYLPFVIVMNLSRIMGGVHRPLDIIAGAILGIISSFTVYYFRNLKFIRSFNNFILKAASYFKL